MNRIINEALLLLNRMTLAEHEEFMARAKVPPPMCNGERLMIHEQWWLRKLDAGCLYHGTWPTGPVPRAPLVKDWTEYTGRHYVSRRGNATAMGQFLSMVCPGIEKSSLLGEMTIQAGEPGGQGFKPGSSATRAKKVGHYTFPPLDVCRREWVHKYGARAWDSVD